jgi:hypothetical protein
MTTATAPAISRAVLEDRYTGLMIPADDRGFTELGLRLVETIEALALGTARHGDIELDDSLGGVASAAQDAVRETIIREIAARGIAR